MIFQTVPGDPYDTISSSVGLLSDHMEAKVVDANGTTVPLGTPGELCIRGYSTMLGYWMDEQKTKEMIKCDMWLHTGYVLVRIDIFDHRHKKCLMFKMR